MPDLATELRRAFMAGIGAFSLTTDRVQSLVDELVAKGEIKEKDARVYVNELLERAALEREALQKSIRDEVSLVVKSMGVVTQTDVKKLESKITKLERTVTRITSVKPEKKKKS